MNTFANTQSASRRALRSKARKLGTPRGSIGAFAVLAIVAASAASAGAFGTFTNSASITQTPIASGTVSLTVGDGTDGDAANRLTIGASNLAAGDDIQRVVNLNNAGTLDLSQITLASSATGSNALSDGTADSLHYTVDVCDQAWTESGDGTTTPYTYTCGGTSQSVLTSTTVANTATALTNMDLSAGAANDLLVTVTLPSGADEATYGGLSTDITYTFEATQRTSQHM
jgi:spore coat-associated protein N